MSPNTKDTRPAYKVEELLALRASASESRVSLDKFPDEEVIKGMCISGSFNAFCPLLPHTHDLPWWNPASAVGAGIVAVAVDNRLANKNASSSFFTPSLLQRSFRRCCPPE